MICLPLTEHTQNAIHSLKSTKARTLLTTTGIAIGVASVVTILSLSSGITSMITAQIDKLDGNIAIVRPGSSNKTENKLINPTLEQIYITSTLTEQDIKTIESIKEVNYVAPLMIISGGVKSKTTNTKNSTILATTPSLEKIINIPISDGQFIDSVTKINTVVIGSQLSIDVFGTEQSIGQTLQIRDQPFTVIGVLKSLNNPINFNGIDFDHAAIISLESGKSFNQGIAQIQQINVRSKDSNNLSALRKTIFNKLKKNHFDEEDFSILIGNEISKPNNDFFKSLTLVMITIAIISLVVGGIGIMNIMLVGVAEKTREIGLRKSVGANNGNIIIQFLIESLLMSIIGGLFGYILGYIVAFIISNFLTFNPIFTWQIAAIALGVSLTVGTTFGIYPAIKASRKHPIESLQRSH